MATPQTLDNLGAPARAKWQPYTVLAALVAAGIAFYCWIESRYPALLKKQHSGKSVHIGGPLSFDALLPVTAQRPFATRVAYTAVDWAYTNRIGMTFGIFFGAAAITLLAALPRRRFANAYANTALGAVIGTPLGVCANCVAPIGRGLVQGGASPATMLAAMIASPTLNVVVIAMAFTLLPLPVAMVRLAAPLVLLALVPLLTAAPGMKPLPASAACAFDAALQRTWRASLGSLTASYFRNLAGLAVTTVPWMLAAGLLGALAAELVPAQSLPAHVSFFGILLTALLGTFAPVPIAFDVALAYLLLSRGVPAPYVATLACTLGAFSVYPFVIVGRSLSWLTAVKIFTAVVVVGMLAGGVIAAVHR
jgi:uncharacterized membrane protein YraQ (UPF0718 family)